MSTPKEQMINQLTEAAYERFLSATEIDKIPPKEAMREIVTVIIESYDETLTLVDAVKEEGRRTS